MSAPGTAAILTIGDELVSGDVPNTNASWLARRLEALGLRVLLVVALRDDVDAIVEFLRREAPRVDALVVTGGLGGTPDDITREAVATAFDRPQAEIPGLAQELRARFPYAEEYVTRWAQLPEGSRPLGNPLGGAPGFTIHNVHVIPGLPSEMEAMFLMLEDELRRGAPIASWRRSYPTTEATIVHVLERAGELHPAVGVGSYPSFPGGRPTVEVVLKSADPNALAAAAEWMEGELATAVAGAESSRRAAGPRYP